MGERPLRTLAWASLVTLGFTLGGAACGSRFWKLGGAAILGSEILLILPSRRRQAPLEALSRVADLDPRK